MVHFHPGDMVVRMREVLARPWVAVCVRCVPLALNMCLLCEVHSSGRGWLRDLKKVLFKVQSVSGIKHSSLRLK